MEKVFTILTVAFLFLQPLSVSGEENRLLKEAKNFLSKRETEFIKLLIDSGKEEEAKALILGIAAQKDAKLRERLLKLSKKKKFFPLQKHFPEK